MSISYLAATLRQKIANGERAVMIHPIIFYTGSTSRPHPPLT